VRILALSALALLLAGPAAARDPVPQIHEVEANADISVLRETNSSFGVLVYRFTPEGLNKVDEVPAELRRFVRHPSFLSAQVSRLGATLEAHTAVQLGGQLNLPRGYVTVAAEGGVELSDVRYDLNDPGYLAAPFRVEVSGRPLPRLAIGARYLGRIILQPIGDPTQRPPSNRDGYEQDFGGVLAFASDNDVFLGELFAGLRRNDWSFDTWNAGDVTVRGLIASLRLFFLVTPRFTIRLSGDFAREDWDNQRDLDSGRLLFEPERRVLRGGGDLGITYWYQGRLGFRFSIGGGFQGSPPYYPGTPESPYGRFGFGQANRF